MDNYKELGNIKLERISKIIGFDLFVFDDKTYKDKFLLREKDRNTEIDSVMVFNNLVFLVDVYSGESQDEALKKIKKSYNGLKNFNNWNDLFIQNGGSSAKEKKDAEEKLNKIIQHIQGVQSKYNLYTFKICFYPELEIDEKEKDKYRDQGVYIIDREVYNYFIELEKALGDKYLFREIMAFFDIKKRFLEKKSSSDMGEPGQIPKKRVLRKSLHENEMIMYSSLFLVSNLEEYTTVFRAGQRRTDVKGFQRMIKKARLDKIAKEYLDQNETFPNNIIIALDPELYKDEKDFYEEGSKSIKLYDEYNSLFIIDGQHRFFSFFKTDNPDREVLVTFVFFKGGKNGYEKIYKMFYKINNKQERIDPSLSFVLKAMIYSGSEYAFWFNVLKKLNTAKGFFKNRISFREKQLRYKDEKGIISVVTYGGLLSLNKTFLKTKSEGLDTFHGSKTKENEKVNFAYNLLKNYFLLIQIELNNQGKNKDDLTPREIGALIRLLRHFIKSYKKDTEIMGNIANVQRPASSQKRSIEKFSKIIKAIKFDEILSSELSSSNWAGVEGMILKQINNKYKSFGCVDFLSKKGKEIYSE